MLLREKLGRTINADNYLPYIDGLRFFAIMPVLTHHFVAFYNSHYGVLTENKILSYLLGNASNGVLLFFAISGFILGKPFAMHYLNNETKPSLKNYFIRRLTRLEPPYILMLTIILFTNILLGKGDFSYYFPHYISSLFYSHNIIYNEYPLLNFVLWSLEIEVQFYILAPFLAKLFTIKSIYKRQFLFLFLILLFSVFNEYIKLPFISILNYIQYFLVGFFAIDVYINKNFVLKNTKINILLFFISLFIIWAGFFKYGIILPFIIIIPFVLIIQSMQLKKIISYGFIPLIGGMCYTIYMLHIPLMNFFSQRVFSFFNFNIGYLDFFLKLIITLIIVLIGSSVYFYLIEKPTMDKLWIKKLIFKIKKRN